MRPDLALDTAPAAPAVTLAEFKALLKVEYDDDDDRLQAHLDAAIAEVDGYAGQLGRALVTQTWVMRLPAFPACREIALPLPPLQSVESVTYYDTDGVQQTLSPSAYEVCDGAAARLVLVNGETWPANAVRARAVEITFVCGYGAADDVPGDLKLAIKLIAAALERGEPTDRDPAIASTLRRYAVPNT